MVNYLYNSSEVVRVKRKGNVLKIVLKNFVKIERVIVTDDEKLHRLIFDNFKYHGNTDIIVVIKGVEFRVVEIHNLNKDYLKTYAVPCPGYFGEITDEMYEDAVYRIIYNVLLDVLKHDAVVYFYDHTPSVEGEYGDLAVLQRIK